MRVGIEDAAECAIDLCCWTRGQLVKAPAAGTDHPGTITIHMRKGNKVEINGSTDIHVQ